MFLYYPIFLYDYTLCFFNALEGLGGLEQMRETCRNHAALMSGQNASMVPSYDKKAGGQNREKQRKSKGVLVFHVFFLTFS